MVKKLINFPTDSFIRFLNWLNRDSTQLLHAEKIKFQERLIKICPDKNLDKADPFFLDWKEPPTKSDVIRLHDKFDKKADAKSSKRVQVLRTLQWVTLILFSALITGIPSLSFPSESKVVLVVVGVVLGIVITKIQKNRIITIRLDAYKYRLRQIQLEKIYAPKGYLPRDVLLSKSLRGALKVEQEEDRDIKYEKYSLTNLSLVVTFLIQILYLGALIIGLLNI